MTEFNKEVKCPGFIWLLIACLFPIVGGLFYILGEGLTFMFILNQHGINFCVGETLFDMNCTNN